MNIKADLDEVERRIISDYVPCPLHTARICTAVRESLILLDEINCNFKIMERHLREFKKRWKGIEDE